jgi:hypothetical protein
MCTKFEYVGPTISEVNATGYYYAMLSVGGEFSMEFRFTKFPFLQAPISKFSGPVTR